MSVLLHLLYLKLKKFREALALGSLDRCLNEDSTIEISLLGGIAPNFFFLNCNNTPISLLVTLSLGFIHLFSPLTLYTPISPRSTLQPDGSTIQTFSFPPHTPCHSIGPASSPSVNDHWNAHPDLQRPLKRNSEDPKSVSKGLSERHHTAPRSLNLHPSVAAPSAPHPLPAGWCWHSKPLTLCGSAGFIDSSHK